MNTWEKIEDNSGKPIGLTRVHTDYGRYTVNYLPHQEAHKKYKMILPNGHRVFLMDIKLVSLWITLDVQSGIIGTFDDWSVSKEASEISSEEYYKAESAAYAASEAFSIVVEDIDESIFNS